MFAWILRSFFKIPSMKELRALNILQLVDLLAVYTRDYYKQKLINLGTDLKKLAKCNIAMRAIQAEIDRRKTLKDKGQEI